MQEFVCRLEPDPRAGSRWAFTLGRASEGRHLGQRGVKSAVGSKKYHLPRSYVEWFCFLTGRLRVLLNVSFCMCIKIQNMTVNLIVMTDIRPNPCLFQDTTKESWSQ